MTFGTTLIKLEMIKKFRMLTFDETIHKFLYHVCYAVLP
jgi:hypothetical protein